MSLSSTPRASSSEAPPAPQEAPHLKFRPDVEGLRCIAVLMVVFDHLDVPGFRGGFIGVDVFFVISGFLITSLLRDEFARNIAASLSGRANISFEGFYLRRAKRILPAALTVIAVVLLGAKFLFTEVRFHQVQTDALWATFFGANIQLMHQATDYFAQTDLVSPLQNFWSLAVEEQFYIVWPALFLFAARLPEWTGKLFDWRHSARTGAALIGVASLGWSIYATATSPGSAYFSTLTRGWELAIGALIALTPKLARLSRGATAHALSWIGAALLVVGLVLISPATGYPGLWAMFPALGCAFLIIAGLTGETTTPVAQGLSMKGPRWIGRISYSLYLWHWPIIVFALALFPKGAATAPARAGLLAASVGMAWISYTFIEQPYRKLSLPKQPMARMQFLSDSRDRLIKMGVAGLVVVGVIAAFARPSANKVAATEGVSAQVSKWASFDGSQNSGAGADASGDLGRTEWRNQLKEAVTKKNVTQDAITLAGQGRALSPNAACFTVRSYKEAIGCAMDGSGGDDMKWPNGLSKSVALVGNSFAAQWRETIASVLPAGTRVVPLTMISCDASAPETDHTKTIYHDDCGKHVSEVNKFLKQLKPGLVIISTPHNDGSTINRIGPFLKRMKGYSKNVLFVSPTPAVPKFEKCLGNGTNIAKCNGPIYPVLIDDDQKYSSQARSSGASMLSGVEVFCLNRTCPAFVGDKPVRFDGFHLTQQTLFAVRGFMRDAIAKAVGTQVVGN